MSRTRTLFLQFYWPAAFVGAFVSAVSRMSWLSPGVPEFVGLGLMVAACSLGIAGNWLGSRGKRRLPGRSYVATSYLLFAAWALASSIWSAHPSYSFTSFVLFAAVSGFAFSSWIWRWASPERVRNDLKLVFWVLVILSISGLSIIAFGIGHARGDYGRFVGLLINPGFAGTLAATVVPLGIQLLQKARPYEVWFICAGMAVGTYCAISSGTKGALLALVLSVIIAIYWSSLKVALQGSMAIGLGGLAWLATPIASLTLTPPLGSSAKLGNPTGSVFDRLPSADYSSGRFTIFDNAWSTAMNSPILGHGFRTTKLLPSFSGIEAHNTYLSVFVELGIVGVLTLLSFLLLVLWRGGPISSLSLLVFVVAKEVSDSMLMGSGSPVALVFWIVIFAFPALSDSLTVGSRWERGWYLPEVIRLRIRRPVGVLSNEN